MDGKEAANLYFDLVKDGFEVTYDEDAGKLWVMPSSRLTDGQRELVRTHRDGLVALLSGPAPEPTVAETPSPPDAAAFYYADERGRPCKPDGEVYFWCWAGGLRWWYDAEHRRPTPGTPEWRPGWKVAEIVL